MPWWQRILARIRSFFVKRPTPELPAPREEPLADDLRAALQRLGSAPSAARDASERAVKDYRDLARVLMGPGASVDAAWDVSVLADAEDVLRSMLTRAPEVHQLARLAAERTTDAEGRAAAGEALLRLRDEGRLLHEVASASLAWAASRSPKDQEALRQCAERLRSR